MLERFSLIIFTLCIIFLSGCQTLAELIASPRTRADQAATRSVIAYGQPSPGFLARPPQKIAVIVVRLTRLDNPRREIEDVFIRTLISKGFRVVSRSDIESLQDEMKFQRSGLTDKDVAELGRILNVPAVMIVAITQEKYSYSSVALGARLVSVEGAEILWAGGTEQFYSSEILMEVAKAVANTIPSYPGIR